MKTLVIVVAVAICSLLVISVLVDSARSGCWGDNVQFDSNGKASSC